MHGTKGLVSVVVVDDHAVVRQALSVMLERRGFRIQASTACVAEARAALADTLPDALVVDLCMPDADGATLIREVRASHPRVKIVVFTGSDDADTVAGALDCGAHGFASKAAGIDELVTALRAVRRGRRHVDPRIEGLVRQSAANGDVLTPRESQILRLLGEGFTGVEIAEQLVLSPETVKTHVRNAMARLEARTRSQAVVMAMRIMERVPLSPAAVDPPIQRAG